MSIPTLPDLNNFPDLIRALNERFRGMGGAGSTVVAVSAQGTLKPDQRPGGLGAADAGLLFFATDTYQAFRWSGVAWVEVTPPANDAQIAYATGTGLNLNSASFADIPGCTLTLARAGRYLITGNVMFYLADGNVLQGQLVAGGAAQAPRIQAWLSVVSGIRLFLCSNQWIYAAPTLGKVVKLQGLGAIGGTGNITQTHTSISALWIGP